MGSIDCWHTNTDLGLACPEQGCMYIATELWGADLYPRVMGVLIHGRDSFDLLIRYAE